MFFIRRKCLFKIKSSVSILAVLLFVFTTFFVLNIP